MSKRETIYRHIFIVKKLRFPQTFEDVIRYLEKESDIHGYDFTVSKRTFQRDIRDISVLYGIDISYNRSDKKYYIENEENPEASNRILEAFDVFNAFNIKERLSQHVYFEKRKPQQTENLYGLLHAIQNRYKIKFAYKKFWKHTPTQRIVAPYALKEFRNRWYIMAKDMKDKKIKSFALDRLSDLEITNERFSTENFDMEAHFRYSFGIISPNESKSHQVVLSFTPHQGKYIKSLPLHHTQRILKDNSNELRIELQLFITHDFLMELLSMGENVKVIQPESLKKQIYNSLKKTLSQYENEV